MGKPKFDIFIDASGRYRWRLKDGNGLKVATSGESFDTRSNAERAARNVKATAPTAEVPE